MFGKLLHQEGRAERGRICGRRRGRDRDGLHHPGACRRFRPWQRQHAGSDARPGRHQDRRIPVAKAVAARRIALALFRESVKETGLSRTTVLKDLLNGETLAQIDGSKAQAVESAVMAKITTRLEQGGRRTGKITADPGEHR